MWFLEKRGRVAVILVSCFHLMLLFPNFVVPLIKWLGWRSAYHVCGIVGGLGISVFAILLKDAGPNRYGWKQDGGVMTEEEKTEYENKLKKEISTKNNENQKPESSSTTEIKNSTADQPQENFSSSNSSSSTSAVVIGNSASSTNENDNDDTALTLNQVTPTMLTRNNNSSSSSTSPEAEVSYTLKEALKTLHFYAFLLGICIVEVLFTGTQFNLLNLLGPDSKIGRAVTEEQLLILYIVMPCTTPIFAVLTGAWIEWARGKNKKRDDSVTPDDEVRNRSTATLHYYLIGILQMLLAIIGCIILVAPELDQNNFLVSGLFVFFIAATLGIQDVISIAGVLFADLFGPKHLGAIQGTVSMMMTISVSFGPLLFGRGAANVEELRILLWTLTAFGIIAVLMLGALAFREWRRLKRLRLGGNSTN